MPVVQGLLEIAQARFLAIGALLVRLRDRFEVLVGVAAQLLLQEQDVGLGGPALTCGQGDGLADEVSGAREAEGF